MELVAPKSSVFKGRIFIFKGRIFAFKHRHSIEESSILYKTDRSQDRCVWRLSTACTGLIRNRSRRMCLQTIRHHVIKSLITSSNRSIYRCFWVDFMCIFICLLGGVGTPLVLLEGAVRERSCNRGHHLQ